MRQNGVDDAINATRTDTGRTALNLAARPGHEEVVLILMQYGARPPRRRQRAATRRAAT